MSIIKGIIRVAIVTVLCNIIFLWNFLKFSFPAKLLLVFLAAALYLSVHFTLTGKKDLPVKLKLLGGGCSILLTASACTVLELALYIGLWRTAAYGFSRTVWIGNGVVSILALAALVVNSLIRFFFLSGQLTVKHRLLLVFLWWAPVVNIAVFYMVYKIAHDEYLFALLRRERNQKRKSMAVCRTRYPLLLVHGIFFRDWKILNYWGRIPSELEENGAKIYYGRQQSSAPVETSAGELKECILDIIKTTGCEKVNIIAHSKGGLDARYAISCLGMDEYTASLTTINTPHRGCVFARKALDNLPDSVVSFVSKEYNKLFAKLGDDHPDFFSGVSELTDEKCAWLNQVMPDAQTVLYESVGSSMKNASSAAFPLNMSFAIVNAVEGVNDGLVAVPSMPWGDFTMLEPVGKRGISHGDMIDLTRKDIKGFDVCEFYVDLVRKLKERGL